MNLKVVVAQAHEAQLQDPEVVREIASIEDAVNAAGFVYPTDAVALIPVRGLYHHANRTMTTVCLFANCSSKPFEALQGEIRLAIRGRDARVAKTSFDFDPDFVGRIEPGEALLVHFNVPVKGLSDDESFGTSVLSASFDNVKARFCE